MMMCRVKAVDKNYKLLTVVDVFGLTADDVKKRRKSVIQTLMQGQTAFVFFSWKAHPNEFAE